MQNIEVKHGQSFLDIVIVSTGNIANCIEMALKNNVSLTDNIAQGERIKVTSVSKKNIVSFFKTNNLPATSIDYSSSNQFLFPNIFPTSL